MRALLNLCKVDFATRYKRIEDNLASHFGTKVKLAHSKNGSGSISIDYYSLQELNKILEQMNVAAS
jgi:ParB family chromosome partitioning protein